MLLEDHVGSSIFKLEHESSDELESALFLQDRAHAVNLLCLVMSFLPAGEELVLDAHAPLSSDELCLHRLCSITL